MKILIQGGAILTATEEYMGDILIEGNKITAIGSKLSTTGARVIDAQGKFVLPGGVDQHVHYSPIMEGEKIRGYETTNAAALGGTTTIIEFVSQKHGMGILESLEVHEEKNVEGVAMVDYSFHPILTENRVQNLEEIPNLVAAGFPSLKLFMSKNGSDCHSWDSTILEALMECCEYGVTPMIHGENGDMIDVLTKKLLVEGKKAPCFHSMASPVITEAEATRRAIFLAKLAKSPLYIVHVSSKDAMEYICQARHGGQSVFGETCPRYLLLDEKDLDRPGLQGAKFVCSPPLRTEEHRNALWQGINRGYLNAIGSDHYGANWESYKKLEAGDGGDFSKIPGGMPGVQNRLNVLWTYGVCRGRISKNRMVELFSTTPARMNGLVQKGNLCVGYDGDVVIFDPTYKSVISIVDSYEGVDYTPYEGYAQAGRVETVLLGGKVIVENGKYIGDLGDGKRVQRKPFGLVYDGF